MDPAALALRNQISARVRVWVGIPIRLAIVVIWVVDFDLGGATMNVLEPCKLRSRVMVGCLGAIGRGGENQEKNQSRKPES